ncbi:MAG TPA: hypothetical protein VGI32_02505 [Steroidobacteraceae bacterium]
MLMLKHLSARGSLFLFVRTHHHLEYYFNMSDARHAANQAGVMNSRPPRLAKVVEIHPISRSASSLRQ